MRNQRCEIWRVAADGKEQEYLMTVNTEKDAANWLREHTEDVRYYNETLGCFDTLAVVPARE